MAIWDEVAEAVSDALNNADGRVSAWYLEYCFMKAGLAVYRMPDDDDWKCLGCSPEAS